MKKVTVPLTRAEADRINALLDIDDIEEVDDQTKNSLNVCEDDFNTIANFWFDGNIEGYIALCSGSMNYWIDCHVELPDNTMIDFEPSFDLDGFEFEYKGEKYVVCIEIT